MARPLPWVCLEYMCRNGLMFFKSLFNKLSVLILERLTEHFFFFFFNFLFFKEETFLKHSYLQLSASFPLIFIIYVTLHWAWTCHLIYA